MRNKYEFKIEDIHTVMVKVKDSSYCTMYVRKTKNNNLLRQFVVRYSAVEEETKDGKISAICRRCERWNVFNKEEFFDDNFNYKCKYCSEDYEEIIGENSLIDIIQSHLTKDLYFDIDLHINGIKIE